jgi:dipeptidyl aminopeptidase/acylaminoacyl peptidase
MKLRFTFLFTVVLALSCCALSQSQGLAPDDLYHLRSAFSPRFSPDGTHIAYVVQNNDGEGRPYGQLWVMELRTGHTVSFSSGKEGSGNPEWSPDSQWIAFSGSANAPSEQGKEGIIVAHPDGSGRRFLAKMESTNSPEPYEGRTLAWSPDVKHLAFVSAEPGPETKDATGDPVVITRYLYKPDFSEGHSHFNDNRRLHIYVADVASGEVKQLTHGSGYEHSIDWSPKGDVILYAAEHGPDADRFFNYDLFTVRVSDGAITQLTNTEGVESEPRWSPDGRLIAYTATKRGLTDRETNMEDMHVWVMNADGSDRREIGAVIDNRQGPPEWSPDGASLYFTVAERGNLHIYRLPINGGTPQAVISDPGFSFSFSVSQNGAVAYSNMGLSDTPQLFLKSGAAASKKLTDLNAKVLGGKKLAEVAPFTFISNDNKFEVQAFLTKPLDFSPDNKYPLVLNIHGGPHGAQGPAFNFRNQVYAAHGYAVLMVNYRGSTSYGQKFADAVFRDQDGDEGMDVLYGVNAALRRYPWLDANRMGIEGVSYGGQLTNWLITQTNMFKAAIPIAGISNFISYNYMTYYNQYEAMEWGAYPHQDDLMNILWERSPLKHVANVSTPTMIMHGENDPDVPIAEAEQMYVALKDVGVETIMVRYPREGHGLREPKHEVDSIERAFNWYDTHFKAPQPKPVSVP